MTLLFACGYPKNAEFYAHFKSVDFTEKGATQKIICQKICQTVIEAEKLPLLYTSIVYTYDVPF